MKDRRLLYRVILKFLTASALLVLLWVFLNSLFTQNQAETKSADVLHYVKLDLTGIKKGEIRKTRWKNKEVAVLHRNKELTNQLGKVAKLPPNIYHSISRSQKAEYFVYFNYGDSGNCPLFYLKNTFKDVCSSKLFDTSGREKNNRKQGYKIEIPPHHFIDEQLYFGGWQRK